MFNVYLVGLLLGPKRKEARGECRRLHNEKLNDLYASPNIIRVIKSRRNMGGACSTYGGKEMCGQDFGGET
jgi:hypothetical protein